MALGFAFGKLRKKIMKLEKEAFSHKQDNRALLKGEAFYRDILEGQTELICRFHPDGAITYVNDAYCRYFGKTLEELIGHSFMPFIPIKDRDKLEKHFSSLTEKNPVGSIEHRVVLPSGEVRWQQWINRAIFDLQGRQIEFQSVGRDLTERIQAEEILQESEKRYRSLISKMGNGFALSKIIYDESGKPCDCRFLEVNPAFKEMAGLNSNDIVGKKVGQVFPGAESFWVDKCGQIALNGNTVQFKNCCKLFNRYFEIIAYSPIEGQVATVFTNITERMEIEAALRESENNFRALAENAHDGILIAVSEDSYIYGNKRAKEISGYSSPELLKGGFKKLIHPDELPKVREIFQRRMAGKQVPGRYETKIVQKGGKVVPIEVSGSKTIWHGQHVIMAIIRDIAARKQIEAELTEAHDELEQRVEARTLELMEAAAELESKHKELLHHKKELEKVNRELVDTNKALSVLARNIDRKREEAEKKISMAISSKIIPVIEGLKNDKTLKSLEAELDVLIASLNELTPGLRSGAGIIYSLSATELRVAAMIKSGLTSPEIARFLHVSLDTIKTHRRSIRRKLNISNSKINLTSFLRLKMG